VLKLKHSSVSISDDIAQMPWFFGIFTFIEAGVITGGGDGFGDLDSSLSDVDRGFGGGSEGGRFGCAILSIDIVEPKFSEWF
jgi:hypothetical protein